MSDIVERLRATAEYLSVNYQDIADGDLRAMADDAGVPQNAEAAHALLTEAAATIEHLRMLAGAVTPGPSFTDIKRTNAQ